MPREQPGRIKSRCSKKLNTTTTTTTITGITTTIITGIALTTTIIGTGGITTIITGTSGITTITIITGVTKREPAVTMEARTEASLRLVMALPEPPEE
jgi:hypothetical protein